MEYTGVTYDMIYKAKQNLKTIVLPESEDMRILKAASIAVKEKIANIILIGNKEDILSRCINNNIDISGIKIEDNLKSEKRNLYKEELFKLRKHKGISLDDADNLLNDKIYYATMMLKNNDADGMVCGACNSTPDTLRPALQIIKARKGLDLVSSFFIMQTPNTNLGLSGKFIFSDCGLVINPTEDDLVEIVLESYDSFKKLLNEEPKIALLSYSTLDDIKDENVIKLQNVVRRVKEINNNINIDGQLQLDAAIIEDVAKIKAPNSSVAGKANVLIFPNLESGNIAYKIAERFGNMTALGPITQGMDKPVNDLSRGCSVAGKANVLIFPNLESGNIAYKIAERFGNMTALGPITQGMDKPVNDLSRGCSVDDIVGVIAITCIQSM